MQIKKFDWNETNASHIEIKHGVKSEETEEIFVHKYVLLKAKHDRYNALGYTLGGRLLSVIFEYQGKGVARVITARDMTKKEIQYFNRRQK